MEYSALILFAIVTCVTPGPNNAMILASGLNHGIRRSLPHFLGICIGFPGMMVAVGLGLATAFARYPLAHTVVKLAGIAYLSYLAWRIATTPVGRGQVAAGKPFSFLQAAAFQWVNPKAWVLVVGALGTYTVMADDYIQQVLQVALIFLAFGAPCIALWLLCGAALQRLLKEPRYRRAFNVTMAALLLASLAPVAWELYAQHGTP